MKQRCTAALTQGIKYGQTAEAAEWVCAEHNTAGFITRRQAKFLANTVGNNPPISRARRTAWCPRVDCRGQPHSCLRWLVRANRWRRLCSESGCGGCCRCFHYLERLRHYETLDRHG